VELRDYLSIARRRWLLIVGSVAVCLGLAAALTAQATPQYVSSAKVFISTTPSNSSDAYQGGLFSQQRVSSYADMATGLELAQRVVDSLNLSISATELAGKISASVVPDTVLLKISVTDPSAAEARRINTAVVEQVQSFVAELETPPGGNTPLLKATVVDPPRLPSSPSSPQPVRNLGLGLVLGVLLGFGLAVLREVMDTSVKSNSDVPELADTPVLSALPFDADVPRTPLITALPANAPRAEAFRVFRTNLQFVEVDHKSKAFVVTSSVPNEGKSVTAVNVALALAQAGSRVLLVDADLRQPQVATLLGLESNVGLTTLLIGSVGLEDAVQRHAQSGLDAITTGAKPPNPAELLQSHAMTDLIAQLRERYDVIVFDAPPLLPVTDAALMAAQTDGAVLVIRYGKTTKEQAGGAVERLHAVDARPLGVVLNMIPQRRGVGSSRYGYGYGYGLGESTPAAQTRVPEESRLDEEADAVVREHQGSRSV
jgi:receptor protein-tyrosine kinase